MAHLSVLLLQMRHDEALTTTNIPLKWNLGFVEEMREVLCLARKDMKNKE